MVGASAFPQNAAQNPTLTAMALALFASEAMIDRYFKHPEQLI
jgi:choline dehydrogenase-like flavoprotein